MTPSWQHSVGVDRRAGEFDYEVAEAAEAWLAEPRDALAYSYLIEAAAERRSYLRQQMDDELSLLPLASTAGTPGSSGEWPTHVNGLALLASDVRLFLGRLKDRRSQS